jgi:hypothetical protein
VERPDRAAAGGAAAAGRGRALRRRARGVCGHGVPLSVRRAADRVWRPRRRHPRRAGACVVQVYTDMSLLSPQASVFWSPDRASRRCAWQHTRARAGICAHSTADGLARVGGAGAQRGCAAGRRPGGGRRRGRPADALAAAGAARAAAPTPARWPAGRAPARQPGAACMEGPARARHRRQLLVRAPGASLWGCMRGGGAWRGSRQTRTTRVTCGPHALRGTACPASCGAAGTC